MVSHYPDSQASPMEATDPVDTTPRKSPSTAMKSAPPERTTHINERSNACSPRSQAASSSSQQMSPPGSTHRMCTPDAANPQYKSPKKKDRLQAFQGNTVQDSKHESERSSGPGRIPSSEQPHGDWQNLPQASSQVLMDTVKELGSVASGTFASLQAWANAQKDLRDVRGVLSHGSEDQTEFQKWLRPPPSPLMRASGTKPRPANLSGVVSDNKRPDGRRDGEGSMPTLLQDLAWPFATCGMEVAENLPKREQIVPHIQKVKEAVKMAVNGDMKAANEIWRFAEANEPEDLHSVITYDTLQEEENNQIRRLASWGTAATGATFDTGISQDTEGTPVEIRLGLEDDDGNAIDPFLLVKTQKSRDKRKPRRRKIVKFDYPPIRSLRQCPRPDPEDLPELFFTEGELDQIEDDRYSTMSTDDVEIVAVASRASEVSEPIANKFNGYAGTPKKNRRGSGLIFSDNQNSRHGSATVREPPESGWKQRNRPSTPFPPQRPDGPDTQTPIARTSSGSEKRLVKGVQIYLRERSTGA